MNQTKELIEHTESWNRRKNERLSFSKKTNLSEILHGVLVGVADVHGKVVVAVHEGNETPYEIVHVLERTCLRSVTLKAKKTKTNENTKSGVKRG